VKAATGFHVDFIVGQIPVESGWFFETISKDYLVKAG
jgi:hypothetical protein